MKLDNIDKQTIRAIYSDIYPNDQKMLDYCVKKTSAYLAIGDCFVFFDKPRIDTKFWFGEHGYDYDTVSKTCHRLSKSEEFFISENITNNCTAAKIHDKIKAYSGKEPDDWRNRNFCVPYLATSYNRNCRIAHIRWCDWSGSSGGYYSNVTEEPQYIMHLDDGDIERLDDICMKEIEAYTKRLHTYLKRYGLSKCHFSTYWADR